MFRLFLRHSLRYFARHRALTALNILGIALGVAVFVSVQTVNHSALQSFRASVDLVAGRADLEVLGDGLPFDERAYPAVRNHPALAAATPLVEATAFLPDYPGEYLQILGVDLFSNRPFRTYTLADAKGERPAPDFLTDPGVIAITRDLAARLGLRIGDALRVRTPGGVKAFRVGFLIAYSGDAVGADPQLAVLDIASAQANFGLAGKLTRISGRLVPGWTAERAAAALRDLLPPGTAAAAPARRGQQIEHMLGAFQLNLTALSLVSVLVGMFLVYNTVAASVVRRRAEIGLLRALGLGAGQVRALFLGEALVLGVAGLAVGLPGGFLLARALIGVVAKNITSLYLLVSLRDVVFAPWALAAAALLGLGAVLAAAWFPADEAARLAPVEALQPATLGLRAGGQTGRWLAAAVLALGLAAALAFAGLRWGPAWLTFGAALATLLGFAFLVPPAARAAARLLRPRAVPLRLAVAHFGASLHRNGVTIAALVVALAMLVGISVMVFSFRQTVRAWLDQSVRADLFVTPAANVRSTLRELLPPSVEATIAARPEVAACDTYREIKVTLDGRLVKLASTRFAISGARTDVPFRRGDSRALFRHAEDRDEAFVTEPLARKFRLGEGDTLRLASPGGPVTLRITGVFSDYTTEGGVILVDRAIYRRHWLDQGLNSLAVYLKPGVTPEEAQDRFRPLVAPAGDLVVYSNRQLRAQVFAIFDQTFAVTNLLEVVGLLVSGLGIFLNLLILVAERRREIGILRAVGARRGQLFAILLAEAALIGGLGAFLGLAAGLALAAVLTWVINIAFFGWTIGWDTPWLFLLTLLPAVVATAVAAGWLPARQASRLSIADAVKME
jgi:putative ABC transport system permease protein